MKRVGQNWNPKGIRYFWKYVITKPRWFVPHFHVSSIAKINWKGLKQMGIQAVVFDKDNTITEPYKTEVPPGIKAAWEECLSVFQRENVVIFSNSAGSTDDDPQNNYPEARRIENALKVPVLRHLEKKPYEGCKYDIEKHWNVVGDDSFLKNKVCVIGDRYFTDVLFGNLIGSLTIATDPLTFSGDPFTVKLVRPFERVLVKLIEKFNKQHKHVHFATSKEYEEVINK